MPQMRVDIARLGDRAKIIGHNCPFFAVHDHGQRTVFGVIAVYKRAVVAPRLRPYPAHGYASCTVHDHIVTGNIAHIRRQDMLKIVRMPADEQIGHPAGGHKSVLDTSPDTAIVGAIKTIGWVMRHHDQGVVGVGVFYFLIVPILLRLGDTIINVSKPDDRGHGRVQYPIVPGEVHGGSLPLLDDQLGLHKIIGKGR